ncbi:MAG: VOC family protein [Sphaerochaeta sp.]|uniref:VOC family protein n=1 Tax=Sphaerochaeta sp. TaxID=1972642 RepID=UPI002FC786DD
MKSIKSLVLGLQHIGVPTNSMEKTKAFYTALGFEVLYATEHNKEKVTFLKLGNVVIETYENNQANMQHGAIDHVALNVSDIDAVFALVRDLGYPELENGIQSLPFFAHGVKFFTIEGPNKEKIEFSQYL